MRGNFVLVQCRFATRLRRVCVLKRFVYELRKSETLVLKLYTAWRALELFRMCIVLVKLLFHNSLWMLFTYSVPTTAYSA